MDAVAMRNIPVTADNGTPVFEPVAQSLYCLSYPAKLTSQINLLHNIG
jgi:hypothetical protein